MGRRKRRVGPPVHSSIRKALGYAPDLGDDDVYADWEGRQSRVCKPCWELKYCPYGPLVEQSPLLPSLRRDAEKRQKYFRECLSSGLVGNVAEITPERREQYEAWIEDDELLLQQAWFDMQHRARLEAADKKATDDEKIAAWLGGKLPDAELNEADFAPEEWRNLQQRAAAKREEYRKALRAGTIDQRTPLEAPRRAWFQKQVDGFSADDYPESIPETFRDAECTAFGHICPVFTSAEGITETEQQRRIGRKQLSFATMKGVVHRDDYTCQHCRKRLQDNEVGFEHIVPMSNGGSWGERNIRLACADCSQGQGGDHAPP